MNRSLSLQPRSSLTDRSHCWAHGPYSASRVPASVQMLKMWSIPVAIRASPFADPQWMRVSDCGGSAGFAKGSESLGVDASSAKLNAGNMRDDEAGMPHVPDTTLAGVLKIALPGSDSLFELLYNDHDSSPVVSRRPSPS